MPAFVAKWSKEHREVLFREAIDRALPVAAVLRAARAGELEGMEPRKQAELGAMTNGYACHLVRLEREARQDVTAVMSAPDALIRELAGQLLKRAQTEVRRITRTSQKPMDTGASLAVLKVLREAKAILEPASKPTGKADKAPAARPTTPASFAARIAARADTAAGNHHTTPDAGDSSAPTGARDSAGLTNEPDAGPARAGASEAGSAPAVLRGV